jgi:hypothetical protein
MIGGALLAHHVVDVYIHCPQAHKHLAPHVLFCGVPLYIAWLFIAFGNYGGH